MNQTVSLPVLTHDKHLKIALRDMECRMFLIVSDGKFWTADGRLIPDEYVAGIKTYRSRLKRGRKFLTSKEEPNIPDEFKDGGYLHKGLIPLFSGTDADSMMKFMYMPRLFIPFRVDNFPCPSVQFRRVASIPVRDAVADGARHLYRSYAPEPHG